MTRPFIFACYSHANNPTVLVEIARLRAAGYDVWYDDHIRGGAEWHEELAQHIQECGWFLFFASPSSVNSPHCRDELNYGIQHHRKILVVELESTEVPAGLQLSLNRRQTLFRHKLDDEDYETRLLNALGDPDTGEPRTEQPQPTGVHGSTSPTMASGGAAASTKDPEMANLEAMLRMPLVRREGWLRRHWLGATFTVMALAALGVFFGRPYFDPAADFDFEGRDWVVLGEFVNDTQVTSLDDSLETGLRVALEQSEFANFIPQSMVREANRRMERDPNAPLDRAAGVEIAKREGAKALIMGQITEIGRRFNISAELIDADTGRTVLVVAETASSLEEVVGTLDTVARELRMELGESLEAIESDSMPLARVTTPDLDALRAFSLARDRFAEGEFNAATNLLSTALSIDPDFAMAHGQLASVYWSRDTNSPEAAAHWSEAIKRKDRLTRRELLYIEASSAWQKAPSDMLDGWQLMSDFFPDEAVGFHNLGMVQKVFFFDFEAAEKAFTAATALPNPLLFASYHMLAQVQMAQEKREAALQNLKLALDLKSNPHDYAIVDAHVVAFDYEAAKSVLSSARHMPNDQLKLQAGLRAVAMFVDEGDLEAANNAAEQVLQATRDSGYSNFESIALAASVAVLERRDDRAAFEARLAEALDHVQERLSQQTLAISHTRIAELALLVRIAMRSNADIRLTEPMAILRQQRNTPFPVDAAYLALVEAELALQRSDLEEALQRVKASRKELTLFQSHESLYRIYTAMEQPVLARHSLEAMRDARGQAFAENFEHYYGQVANVADWKFWVDQLERESGDKLPRHL